MADVPLEEVREGPPGSVGSPVSKGPTCESTVLVALSRFLVLGRADGVDWPLSQFGMIGQLSGQSAFQGAIL